MIAQWDSSPSVLPVARVQFLTMAEYSPADHRCCLLHSSESTKEWSGAPLQKRLQSHEDHEISTDQPGLWSESYLDEEETSAAADRLGEKTSVGRELPDLNKSMTLGLYANDKAMRIDQILVSISHFLYICTMSCLYSHQ